MRTVQNDCVGCPQGCVNCGRKYDYIVITCDECGALIDKKTLYEFEGKELCIDCIFENYANDLGVCTVCGERDILIDGLCKECIESELQMVEE